MPTPGVDSINAHFDYSRALPAVDNADGTTTNLFTDDRRERRRELVRGQAPVLDGLSRRPRHRRRRGGRIHRRHVAGRRLGEDLRRRRRALGREHRLRLRRHRHRRLLGQADGRLRRQSQRLAHHRRGTHAGKTAVRREQRHPEPVRPEGPHGVDLLRAAHVPPQHRRHPGSLAERPADGQPDDRTGHRPHRGSGGAQPGGRNAFRSSSFRAKETPPTTR